MADRKKPKSHYFSAANITAIYVVAAVAWIFISEYFLVIDLDQQVNVFEYQSLKDWGFVLVTTLVLYYLVLFQLKKYSHYLQRYKLQRSEMRLLSQFRKSIIDNASIWINVLDTTGYVTVWNKAAEEISGYRREEVLKNIKVWEWLYPDPQYRESVFKINQEIINLGAKVEDFETSIRTKSGQEKIVAWNSRRFLNDKEEVMGSIAIGRDITVQKRAVRALRERENQMATLMDSLPGMAYRCLNDKYWTMKFVSSGCKKLTGYDSGDLTDNRVLSYASIVHEEDLAAVEREVSLALKQKRPFEMEYRIRRRDGKVIWVWEQGQAVNSAPNQFLEGIILDINQRKIAEQELERMATHDPLTGLYNRRELEQQLQEELVRARRYDRPISLLWLDVDHFKRVNDEYGHLVGDKVLRKLSRLLQSNIRSVDYVARYGGEELVIVLPEVDEDEAMEMAERLRRMVEATKIEVGENRQVSVTVSIGVAAFPEHGKEATHLFRNADEAMYRAKQQGRNLVVRSVGKSMGAVV
jgi:diguanylate cyclase (GGDEF)-like protein/PAS domain S-box-containing protein